MSKFRNAFQGLVFAMRGQSSFVIHLVMAAAVIGLAAICQVEAWRWAVLLLAIGMVLALETINSTIECLVHRLHPEHDPEIGKVLDMAAGAVLLGAIFAAAVGLIVLLPPLLEWFG